MGYVKRWLLLFGGILLILAGLSMSALGAAALSLFNADDSVSTPVAHAKATGSALLIENIRIDASSIPLPHNLGTLQLSASSPTGSSLFLGEASANNVDTFLTGAPYDVVVELSSGGKVITRPVPGTQTPAPPNSQHFWTQQSNGTRPSISALVHGDDTVVLMNSDASQGFSADFVVSLRLPGARKAGWIAVALGALLIVLGGLALWRSNVAKRAALAAAGAHVALNAGHEHPHEPDAPHHHHAFGEPITQDPEVPSEAVVEPAVDPTLIPPWVLAETSDAVETKPFDGTGTSTDSA